jgi:hypothetical protein
MNEKHNVVDLARHRAAKKAPRVRRVTVYERFSFRAYTIERQNTGGQQSYNVYGWFERPDQNALQAQDLTRNIVGTFASLEEAVTAYPKANIVSGRLRQLVLRAPWPEEWATLEQWQAGVPDHRPPPKDDVG